MIYSKSWERVSKQSPMKYDHPSSKERLFQEVGLAEETPEAEGKITKANSSGNITGEKLYPKTFPIPEF
jgi:hypothetical protein